jgi:hypothetical protein
MTVFLGSAALTALFAAVWVASACWVVVYVSGRTYGVGRGIAFVQTLHAWESPYRSPGWHAERSGIPMYLWWTDWDDAYYLNVPLWVLVAASALAVGVAWRFDILARRRARLNLCPKCNYDRAGLAVGAKCPECGAGAGSAKQSWADGAG